MRPLVVVAALFIVACVPQAVARDPIRVAVTRDAASGPIAVPFRIEHAHHRHPSARLLAMQWVLDGEVVRARAWSDIEGAPAFDESVWRGVAAPGDHELAIIAEYRVWTCCYACGYMSSVRLRTTHRFHADERGAIAICTASGAGSPLTPIEQVLAAQRVPCPSAPR